MRVLVTGGCGYIGSVLVPNLAKEGHQVTVIDTQWFGNFLPRMENVSVLKMNFSDIGPEELEGVDCVIHLASVANDPSVELNPLFSWEVNVLNTTKLLSLCKKVEDVKTFLYASSGSVYGVKEDLRVTEDVDLVPISSYNKTKLVAERVCLSYSKDFDVYCIRPATVCGLSPRMRFDVVVNMFVMQAYKNMRITVLGGEQVRPNIHIDDMSRVYEHFLRTPGLPSGCYNAGFENISVLDIAKLVAEKFNVEIEIKSSNDPRSYRLDSSKLLQTGYQQTKTVENAIDQMSRALESGEMRDDDRWHTVKWMIQNNIGMNNG